MFYEFEDKGIKMLAKSPPIAEHLFVASNKLSTDLVKKIRNSLLSVGQSPKGRAILKSIKGGVTNLVPVSDHDYDDLRNLMKFVEE